ncbi:hypothetical protein EXW89_29655, partial [Klebsiella pneumoniae]|nr:hypothetical protein [Klebsiella pneumoniae]
MFFFIFFSYLKVIKIDSFLVYHTSAMTNLTQNLLKKDNSSILKIELKKENNKSMKISKKAFLLVVLILLSTLYSVNF